MTKQKPRGRPPKDPAARSQQILAAAVRLFAKNGYRGTELQVIADLAGIAKGTIYLYFDTKKELFLAAVEHAFERLAERIGREVEAASGPVEKVKAVVRAYIGFFEEDRPLVEIIAQDRGEFRSHAEETYFGLVSENVDRLEDIIREGIVQGVFRPVNPRQATETLINLLTGTMYTHMVGKSQADSADATDAITDLLLHGIVSEGRRNEN